MSLEVKVAIELSSDELTRLKALEGKTFLTAEDIHEALVRMIRRELDDPVEVLGPLHSVIYTREDPRRGYRHVFPFDQRPALVWDGARLKTAGGRYHVSKARGIIELGEKNGTR